MMILPGIGGQWLDKRWDTTFLGPLGFAVGLTTGIWQLLRMTKTANFNTRRTGGRAPHEDAETSSELDDRESGKDDSEW